MKTINYKQIAVQDINFAVEIIEDTNYEDTIVNFIEKYRNRRTSSIRAILVDKYFMSEEQLAEFGEFCCQNLDYSLEDFVAMECSGGECLADDVYYVAVESCDSLNDNYQANLMLNKQIDKLIEIFKKSN